MRLKALTGSFLVAIVLLLGFAPSILGPLPKRGAAKAMIQEYSVRSLVVLALLLLLIVASAVGAWMILRREQEAFREESLTNMKLLVEGSIMDLKKEGDASSGSS
jgi:hypothetical protein